MPKTFVVDTNVLLHTADALESFSDNIVVLPMAVIEELDKFKTHNDELGRNSRQVIRRLDKLRERGRLAEGVPTDYGGIIRVMTGSSLPNGTGLQEGKADNYIIRVAHYLHSQSSKGDGEPIIFVSKDINARIKASALGIEAMDFEKQKVNFDELFTGYREIDVPAETVDNFYEKEKTDVPDGELFPNEFVLLRDITNPKHTALAKAISRDQVVHLCASFERAWNIKPRSKEQRMAMELLMDPGVQVVTLVGQAGTGKTLLALAAGLEAVIRHKKYDKMLVSRPIIPLGKDIGYLPGAKDEKLVHWMQPIFDNLMFLLRDPESEKEGNRGRNKKIDELMKDGIVDLEAVTYIRGRSIPRQYVIVDEAQNLTPHEVKTIVSRAGEGTKVVLTGDPYQIDNPYLDSSSNGLTYTVERLKGQDVHGHITLRKSERSALAAIAAEYL